MVDVDNGVPDPLPIDDDRVTYIEPCRCQECGGKCSDEYHYCRGKVYCTGCYQVEVAKLNAVASTFTGEP